MKNDYLLTMFFVYTGLGVLIGLGFSFILPQVIPIPDHLFTLFLIASVAAGIMLGIINHLVFYYFVRRFTHYFNGVLKSVRNGDLRARSGLKTKGILGELNTNINKTIADLEKSQNAIHHDDLTGLPNRQALQQFFLNQDNDDKDYALLFLDVDRFKQINDTYGHVIGDEVLRYISFLLHDLAEGKGKVFRLSGDEFIIVHELYAGNRTAWELCQDIHQHFREPFFCAKHCIPISISIGVYEFCFGSEDFITILDQADQEMYKVKKRITDGFDVRKRRTLP
ncbi:GGDEF domain-containing protein [Halobacillus litoralis]|uniref:GGDEF domain-containing protein n=1 Tax=Halobacillus litoralis TaxID=45668 RepID=A0A410MIF8_9BACI|nr:GGDEF domain-containing protein [Halobacillus litoralis]QAS54478.1 hypothetical protein HLI_20785 [Halobacillus litoralis]